MSWPMPQFFLIATIFTLSLNAEDFAVIGLRINGNDIRNFGKQACEDGDVEVVLPPKITGKYSSFRSQKKIAPKGDEKKLTCPKKVHENASKVSSFSKSSPFIKQKALMSLSACQDKNEGEAGEGILCIYPSSESGDELLGQVKYSFDTKVAKLNDYTDIYAVNGVIEFKVNYTSGQTIKTFDVCYGKESLGDMGQDCNDPFGLKPFSTPNIKLTDLENGSTYLIKVRMIDETGNQSPWGKLIRITPKEVALPLSAYDGAGGNLMWSCQSTSSVSILFVFLVLLVFAFIRLKRTTTKHLPYLLLVFFVVNFSGESHAELGQVSAGILGSMYRPDLDNEQINNQKSIYPFYRNFFAKKSSDSDGPILPLMGAELDVHLMDKFGSLRVGLGFGYTFVRGKGLALDQNKNPDQDNPLSEAPVSLHIYQLRPQLTYVFDPFAHVVPLVPYVRAAFIANGYSFLSGDNQASSETHGNVTVKPNGFRFGWQAGVGMMLRLDFLEPGAIRSASGSGFFDHVALKAELSYTKINSFGPGFNFSAKDVMGTKLPLLWTFGLVFDLP